MITIFKNAKDVNNPHLITIGAALERIRVGGTKESTKNICERIQAATEKKERNAIKLELPLVVFAGEFSKRSIDGLVKSECFAVVDFDDTDEEPDKIKEQLKNYDFIYSAFISPSGNGIKAVVKIPPVTTNAEYKKHYFAILDKLNLADVDESTSDISRGCYESYDPNIYINENAVVFTGMIDNLPNYRQVKKLKSPEYMFNKIVSWNEKTRTFKSGARNEFIFTLACNLNRFGMNEQTALQLLLSKYEQPDFDFEEISSIVSNVYERFAEEFNTNVFETPQEFYERLEKPVNTEAPRDFAAMAVNPSEMSEKLHSFYRGELQMGRTTGIPKLDNYFRFKDNEFFFFVADGGIGKSTSIQFFMTLAAKFSDVNAIVVMKENDYAEVREGVVSFLVADSYKMDYEGRYSDILEAEKFFDQHFILLKSNSVRSFEDDIEPFYKWVTDTVGRKIDLIIVDPISGMGAPQRLAKKTGDDLHTELSEYYRDWAIANCSIWCISHTNVNKQRMDAYPRPQDGLHGGRYHNAAHVSCTFYRDLKGQGDSKYKTEFRIFKQRSRRFKGGNIAIDPPIGLHYRTSPFGFDVEVDGVICKNPFVKDDKYFVVNADSFTKIVSGAIDFDESPF